MSTTRSLHACLAAAFLAASGCDTPPAPPQGSTATAEAPKATQAVETAKPVGSAAPAPPFDCKCDQGGPPKLDPSRVPRDVSRDTISSAACQSRPCQQCFDCFGWQIFIALNWPAGKPGQPDPEKPFGKPGDLSPLVWETYADVNQVFGGKPLGPWGEGKIEKILSTTGLRGKMQADHNWLTDRDGNLVHYDIRINQDLYEYIRKNELNTRAGQLKAFQGSGPDSGLRLPDGSEGDDKTGTIEVKAAWRIVPADKVKEWEPLYKLSTARIEDPGKPATTVTVALIGLHIAKKTPKLHQWAWATFEHELNAPLVGETPDRSKKYNLWNADLEPDAGSYTPSYKSAPDAHGRPPTPKDRPVQVRRVTDFNATAKAVNKYIQDLLADKYPESVFRHYRLVSVQWPLDSKEVDRQPTLALPDGHPIPPVVANITMETYMQEKNGGGGAGMQGGPSDSATPVREDEEGRSSCIGCHRLSATTPPFAGNKSIWYTDYSAIFFKAK